MPTRRWERTRQNGDLLLMMALFAASFGVTWLKVRPDLPSSMTSHVPPYRDTADPPALDAAPAPLSASAPTFHYSADVTMGSAAESPPQSLAELATDDDPATREEAQVALALTAAEAIEPP